MIIIIFSFLPNSAYSSLTLVYPLPPFKFACLMTYKNKTWSQVCCSVPQSKGLRIAQSVGTSNAESPTSMMYIDPHALTVHVKLINEGIQSSQRGVPVALFFDGFA